MKKKYILIIISLLTIILIISYILYINNKQIDISNTTNTYEPEIKSEIYKEIKEVKISIFKKNKETIINKKMDISNIKEIINIINKEFNINIIVDNNYINNRTLYINFNKNTNFKFKNIDIENDYLKSIIYTFLNNSKEFDDIQFLKNNIKENYIFGSINSLNPFTKNY